MHCDTLCNTSSQYELARATDTEKNVLHAAKPAYSIHSVALLSSFTVFYPRARLAPHCLYNHLVIEWCIVLTSVDIKGPCIAQRHTTRTYVYTRE